MRYRIFYEKRREACFVPHIALQTVFSRSAARAGVIFQRTEGFSPHAKISFGPELPVGVVALCEPVDVWVESLDEKKFAEWNSKMPSGFSLKKFETVQDGAQSIGKAYPASFFLVKTRDESQMKILEEFLREDERILKCRNEGEFMAYSSPNTTPVSVIVRSLVEKNAVRGWHELCIVRLRLGGLDDE